MRRRSLAGAIAASALAFGFLMPPMLAGSAPSNDPRAEREKVQAEQAKVAAALNTTKASKAEIDHAIEAALIAREDGQGTVEYIGLILLLAGIMAAVVALKARSGADLGATIVGKLKDSIDGVGDPPSSK